MLYRKIEALIEAHLKSDSKKILLVDGAQQMGKPTLSGMSEKNYPRIAIISIPFYSHSLLSICPISFLLFPA